MRFQILFFLVVILATYANGLQNFFDRLRNGGRSLEAEETSGLGTKLSKQLNELTYNLMPKTTTAAGELINAIQKDLSQISKKIQDLQLTEKIERNVNKIVDDIKGFISTLSKALDQDISKTFNEVIDGLLRILPETLLRIFSLIKAEAPVDDLFSNTWEELSNANLLKAILSDLNPSNLMASIRKQTDSLGGINGIGAIGGNLLNQFGLGDLSNSLSKSASGLLDQFGLKGLSDNLSKNAGGLLDQFRFGSQSGDLSKSAAGLLDQLGLGDQGKNGVGGLLDQLGLGDQGKNGAGGLLDQLGLGGKGNNGGLLDQLGGKNNNGLVGGLLNQLGLGGLADQLTKILNSLLSQLGLGGGQSNNNNNGFGNRQFGNVRDRFGFNGLN